MDFVTNEEVIIEARKRLAQGPWDYLVGGSESETSLRRNRQAYDRIAFRPRVLVDVSKLDTSATLLGQPLRIPVVLAPVGSLQVFTPDGAAASARAAAAFGITQVVSSASQPSIEDVAAATSQPKIYQLYIRGDWDWTKDQLTRIKNSGYIAVTITVDTANSSRRERPMLTRYQNAGPTVLRDGPPTTWAAEVTWDTVAKIKDFTGLPLLLKGIGTAEDAAIAVQRGVDVIWASNHGGRQLDHSLGTLDTLPEIVQAVGGKAQIIADGGISRGTDVLKAIAIGANAVAIGRLQGYGLAAGGTDGVVRVLEILEAEIRSAMGLMGVTSMAQLNSKYITPAVPVVLGHEQSAWINMPGGRVQ